MKFSMSFRYVAILWCCCWKTATVSVVADDSLSFFLLDYMSVVLLCFSAIKATQKIPLQLCTRTTALLPLSLLLW